MALHCYSPNMIDVFVVKMHYACSSATAAQGVQVRVNLRIRVEVFLLIMKIFLFRSAPLLLHDTVTLAITSIILDGFIFNTSKTWLKNQSKFTVSL